MLFLIVTPPEPVDGGGCGGVGAATGVDFVLEVVGGGGGGGGV